MGKHWSTPLGNRIKYWWMLVWRGWWKPMIVIWGIIATYDTVVQQFFPDTHLPSIFELTYSRFPVFGWRLWAIIGFALLLLAALEGAYRRKQAFEHQIHELQTKIDKIASTKPIPRIQPRILNNQAFLEVFNDGESASFKATARIIGGKRNDCLYSLPTFDLNKGGMARILLGDIPSKFLVLYDDKGQPFVYLFKEEIDQHDSKERYPKSYLDMSKGVEPPEDKCTLEVTITSSPSPIETLYPKQYVLAKDVQRKLLIAEIVPNSDKEVPQL